jgi:competence protein ComGC
MRANQFNSEAGFTLVELLIVTGTLSILVTLSVYSYDIYKKSAFDKSTQSSVHHAQGAMQAGLIDNDFMEGSGLAWVSLSTSGQPSTQVGRDLLPGYMNPSNLNLTVMYDAWCANGLMGEWCMLSYFRGQHCRGDTVYLRQSFRSGAETILEWQAPPGGC